MSGKRHDKLRPNLCSEETSTTHNDHSRGCFFAGSSPERSGSESMSPPRVSPTLGMFKAGIPSEKEGEGQDRRTRKCAHTSAEEAGFHASLSSQVFRQENGVEARSHDTICSRRAELRNDDRLSCATEEEISVTEAEWLMAHRLVKFIRTATETSCYSRRRGPTKWGLMDTRTLPGTEQSSPRSDYNRRTAPQGPEAESARMGVGELDIEGDGKIGGHLSKPGVRREQTEPQNKEGGGKSEVEFLPGYVINSHCTEQLRNHTGEEHHHRASNTNETDLPVRTPRAGLPCSENGRAGASECPLPSVVEHGDLTETDMLIAEKLLVAIRAAVQDRGYRFHNRDGPLFPPSCAKHELEAQDTADPAMAEDTGAPNLQEEADKREKNCGHVDPGHAAGYSGGAKLAKVNVVPSSDSATADLVQPVWTNSDSSEEAAGAAARLPPKKTIAEQVLEVSERLDKIFELR